MLQSLHRKNESMLPTYQGSSERLEITLPDIRCMAKAVECEAACASIS